MTDAQIQAYVENSLKAANSARGDFFEARMDYAKALGRGNATEEMRKRVVTLREKYEAL